MEQGEFPYTGMDGLEAMLAAREAEQPGSRAQWDAWQTERRAEHDQRELTERQARSELIEGLTRAARSLTGGAQQAFRVCMDPPLPGSPSLPQLALKYRQELETQAKPPCLKGVREELQGIEEAACELRKRMKRLTPAALKEIRLAGELAAQGSFPDLLLARDRGFLREVFVKHGDSSMSHWEVRLHGLETFANLLGTELETAGNGAKNLWEESRRESPCARLHDGILRLLHENNLSNRWLEHLARVVGGWAVGQDPIDLPLNWGKAERTRARRSHANSLAVIDAVLRRTCALERRLWLNQRRVVRRGRTGRIKH